MRDARGACLRRVSCDDDACVGAASDRTCCCSLSHLLLTCPQACGSKCVCLAVCARGVCTACAVCQQLVNTGVSPAGHPLGCSKLWGRHEDGGGMFVCCVAARTHALINAGARGQLFPATHKERGDTSNAHLLPPPFCQPNHHSNTSGHLASSRLLCSRASRQQRVLVTGVRCKRVVQLCVATRARAWPTCPPGTARPSWACG